MNVEHTVLSEPANVILDNPIRIQSPEALIVRLSPREAFAALREKWIGMEAVSEHTFFTSWHWISNWMETVDAKVLQCEAWAGDELVGLGLFVETRVTRGLVPLRRLFLNRTGIPTQDRIGIEGNDLLIKRGLELPVRKRVIELLIQRPGVDEVVFGLTGDGHDAGVACAGIRSRIGWSDPVPWVDLRRVAAEGGYDQALSAKNRNNVRRSLRKAENLGKVEVRSAATVEEALRFFREAGPYHIERFKDGKPDRQSGYLNPTYVAFHEKLIRSGFNRGLVDLVKITAGEAVMAYMYYFVYRKCAYAYQSAINYALQGSAADGKMSPGLMANYLCIVKFAAQGMQKFDFLAGDYYYKRALATDSGWMRYYVYGKPSLKMAAVEKLVSLKPLLARLRG